MTDDEERIDKAVEIAYQYGSIDGEHHKEWVIDQMVRVLLGDHYYVWVTQDDMCTWSEGIAP